MQRAVRILSDVADAEVLTDPVRRLILDLLAVEPMTEAQLAHKLELSEPSVNHHLKELMGHGLIRVSRTEVESHGIVQKFYMSAALITMMDYPRMPYRVRRYAFHLYLERMRGALAALMLTSKVRPNLSWSELEKLTENLAGEVVSVAGSIKATARNLSKEDLILRIYTRALRRLAQGNSKEAAILRRLLSSTRR